ncbi:MAG: hypothetical protein KME31_19465 [Tolypothrix carrinoi HA7290-LM1]|jgi:hypothetical protein|nr:hypothetical protein [Tolypothrix carrinoi HA7290-LM1]
MAEDIYNSCITKTKYISFLVVPDSAGSFTQREEQEKICETSSKPTSKNVARANAILTEYIDALVYLANGKNLSGQTISFDENFTKLGNSLKSLSIPGAAGTQSRAIFNESEVNAGISIAKFLTNVFTKEFRRDKLKQAILCTDKDIQTYIKGSSTSEQPTGGLIALTQQGYINLTLEIEEEKIRGYFTDYIAVLGSNPNSRILDFRQLEEKYNEAMDNLRKRRDNAETYIEVLSKVAEMHAKLKTEFEGKNNLNDAQLQNYCKDFFQPKTEKVASKDKSVKYDAEELRKVTNIVSEYTKVLKPLIQKLDETR